MPFIQAVSGRFDRLWPDGAEDNRLAPQRDRDRILYTSAFQRLAEVTQVVAPDEGHVFHNRLTHSLKVAQVARRIAELLLRTEEEKAVQLGIDPDVAEAAGLAHDLGHPPFGHIAEEELNRLMTIEQQVLEGFDGNAQSFRIIAHLARRCASYDGLNLTRGTLNAVLKYPWMRESSGKRARKWGAFSTEHREFEFARASMAAGDGSKSPEAEIMDLADDITYAVHDLADFYRAGLIPLHRLVDPSNSKERDRYYAEVFQRRKIDSGQQTAYQAAFEELTASMPFERPYEGTATDRSTLKSVCSGLISRYVQQGVAKLDVEPGPNRDRVQRRPEFEPELFMLKELTWHYVILNPALATQQYGQRIIIRTLFKTFQDASDRDLHDVDAHDDPLTLFPHAFRELLRDNTDKAYRARVICDYIAGMTERQAYNLHRKLTGVNPASGLR